MGDKKFGAAAGYCPDHPVWPADWRFPASGTRGRLLSRAGACPAQVAPGFSGGQPSLSGVAATAAMANGAAISTPRVADIPGPPGVPPMPEAGTITSMRLAIPKVAETRQPALHPAAETGRCPSPARDAATFSVDHRLTRYRPSHCLKVSRRSQYRPQTNRVVTGSCRSNATEILVSSDPSQTAGRAFVPNQGSPPGQTSRRKTGLVAGEWPKNKPKPPRIAGDRNQQQMLKRGAYWWRGWQG